MTRPALALALAALSVSACAGAAFAPAPPARFRQDGQVALQLVGPDHVAATCEAMGAPPGARACERAGLIVFPNPCAWANASDLRDLLCHELGHANGWPATHPKD